MKNRRNDSIEIGNESMNIFGSSQNRKEDDQKRKGQNREVEIITERGAESRCDQDNGKESWQKDDDEIEIGFEKIGEGEADEKAIITKHSCPYDLCAQVKKTGKEIGEQDCDSPSDEEVRMNGRCSEH